MGFDDRCGNLFVFNVYLLSRRVPNSALGSEMKLRLAMIMLLVVLWAGPAFAQGCAMCYSNASGTTKEGQRAISRGVVILLVPPVGFMTLGVGMALRYGKWRDEEKQEEYEQDSSDEKFVRRRSVTSTVQSGAVPITFCEFGLRVRRHAPSRF